VVAESNEVEESGVERVTSFSNPVLVKKFERARDLAEAGYEDWARWELVEIERRTSNREYLKLLMQEYESIGNYYRSSYIGQIFFGMQRAQHGISGIRYLWEHTYPQAYSNEVKKSAEEWGIPTELIWGIMRAESHYRKEAISPVGALGLMQVMPNTGNRIASMISQKNFTPAQLLEPPTAIRIGSRYLQRLMRKFESNTILVAAGYNAGPHRVKKWLHHFGHLDMDEFIEHIPFLETRNYVKKVASNMHIYSQLYANKSDFMRVLALPISVRFTEPVPTRETWEDI
jgi:soluble lytic murein transglycosylase